MTYRVECRNDPGEPAAARDFLGLTYDRAVERCEAERGKAWWATVRVVAEADGLVVASYFGGAAADPGSEGVGRG